MNLMMTRTETQNKTNEKKTADTFRKKKYSKKYKTFKKDEKYKAFFLKLKEMLVNGLVLWHVNPS